MKKIKLKIIPKPDGGTATVLTKGESENRDPIIAGDNGSYELVCGSCEFTLATKVEFVQINDIVLHCPVCESYNISN